MKALNKETAPKTQRPERIIQFGEGNFLRAFVDWIIYNMNQKTDFNSSVVVVQPIDKGMVDMLNAQDDLYHVNLQGLDKGEVVNSLTMIDVISRALNHYTQNDEFMKLAEQPEMRFVISNTTEAGIAFDPTCKLEDAPASSYPGKLTQLLYHRFKTFNGDKTKGLIIFPCELIFLNGHKLKETIYQYIQNGTINMFQAFLFAVIAIAMIAVVVAVTQGQRRIPIQYAKRVVGRKMYGGHSTFLPLKVNQAGVIPIIFASSVLMFPVTIAQFIENDFVHKIADLFTWGTPLQTALYAILIFIFTYFYTAISINITDMADNMKKYGGFIPGIRAGKPTADYVDNVMTKITLAGAVFLAIVAIIPNFLGTITGVQGVYFGGTALLIVVGVALDTMQQIESLMVTRHYKGFVK